MNWKQEFQKWTPHLNVEVYHGSKSERASIRSKWDYNNLPIVCTSYEISLNDRNILSKINWKLMVVDEGHRLKNLNSVLIKNLKLYNTENRLLLTGTPLNNNLRELWEQ
jgi:ATP-dependent DNA helicase